MAMALRSRIKRLEETSRKLAAWQLPDWDDPASESLAHHPETRALLNELAVIIARVIEEKRPVEIAEFRQGIIGNERGAEILCLLSEIASGLR
jgi:hypothetical protein